MSARHLYRVAVLAGGDSAEREVSLRSGTSVAAALEAAGHAAELVDPAATPIDSVDWPRFDGAFIALHGGAGEDGRIQQQLETLGVPYTGSDPRASRLAMSKAQSKRQFIAAGVPTLPFAFIGEHEPLAEAARRARRLGYPVVVKPDAQGSSVGVGIAEGPEALCLALVEARAYGGQCILERLVRGREFTVAVLDDRPLPAIEIVTPEPVFSYDAKYASSLTEYRLEFALTEPLTEALVAAAVGAVRALGTAGLARVDLMLEADGRPWVLEVNTIPGMTVRSLAPLAAARAGIDMPQLCELLVQRSLVAAGAV
jgi:D-alanine-D-alanine ligase